MQQKTYGSIWKKSFLQFSYKNNLKFAAAVFLSVLSWKVPNEIDEHVTILECLGLTIASEKTTTRAISRLKPLKPWGSWSQKLSLLLGLDDSRWRRCDKNVGWSQCSCFFGTNVWKYRSNCFVLNEFFTGREPTGIAVSCKLPFEHKRPNSCAFGPGKLSSGCCWHWNSPLFWAIFGALSSWWPSSPRAETISRQLRNRIFTGHDYRLPKRIGGETTPWT